MKIASVYLILLLTYSLTAQETVSLAQAQSFAQTQKALFEENKGQVWDTEGQTASQVKYHYQQNGLDIFMLSTGIAYQFSKVHYPEGYFSASKKDFSPEERAAQKALEKEIYTETYRMDMELIGANPHSIVLTEGKSKDYVQYYNRNALQVHSFQKLIYKEVYPGIDWVIYTTDKGLKYDFVVQAGADPSLIQFQFQYHENLVLKEDGSFTLSNRMGSITEEAPVSFQGKQRVATSFVLDGDKISFELGEYDETRELVVDPNLIWATYYGGNRREIGERVSVDKKNHVYLSGTAFSYNNISQLGHQNTSMDGWDAFLVKFDSNGVRLWATYYGGNNNDFGIDCHTDKKCNVILTGETNSSSNIAMRGYQDTLGGDKDIFLVKFDSNGVRLWATYYGGNNLEVSGRCTIDKNDKIYLSGTTNSPDSIALRGHQNNINGSFDAFLVNFDSNGVRLWATYYGGSVDDNGNDIAVDSLGHVYLSGVTNSPSNIAIGGHQNNMGGSRDAFLVKFDSNGVRLWATYYGGTGNDYGGNSCYVYKNSHVYMSGYTSSNNNIAFLGHQNNMGGSFDAFVVKFDSSGRRLWGTYYGGSGNEYESTCVTDSNGNLYLSGETSSRNNIAFIGHQNTFGGSHDAFVVKFDSSGNRLWGTYYGWLSSDRPMDCTVDNSGNLYLSGETQSHSGISFLGHQDTLLGNSDAFLVKLKGETMASAGIDYQVACDSFTWIDGITYTSSTNTPTHIITNYHGCDSIITLNLIINNSATIDHQVACDSFTWIDGITYTSSTNTPTFTLTNNAGCDSIITLNLIINNSATINHQVACDSFTWIDGITYTSSTNTPTFTLTNNAGCDSVITLNLYIYNSTALTLDYQTACDSFTWINGITYTNSTSIPTFTLQNAIGCDSTVTLDLTIINSSTATDSQTACNAFTWIDGITYTSSTNTPTFTLTNATGCDSIVTLDLTISNNVTAIDSQTACNAFTWIDGITYTSSTNTPTFTLTSTAGCDSTVTLNLIINNNTSTTDFQVACDSFTWINGITYTSSTNAPTFTLTSAAGCDSILNLNLILASSTTRTDTYTACDSFTWIDGNTYTSSTDSATLILTNPAGCNLEVTLDLTIAYSSSGVATQVACDSFTWMDGITYTNSTNTPTFTLQNTAGCDSIINLNLTINNSSTFTDTQTTCFPFTWIDGNTYNSSTNTPTFMLTNAAGCDSTVTLDLTVNTADTALSIVGNTLVAAATGANYQWIDCDNNNLPILGATSQSFSPTSNGNYALIVGENGCTDTSACFLFTGIGIQQLSPAATIHIYPNPTEGVFSIDLRSLPQATVSIYSVEGKNIAHYNNITGSLNTFNLDAPAGVYIIQVKTDHYTQNFQLIKQ